eukprot:scaffold72949_cov35-Tisochrysis_lutea.AAC.3
MGRKPACIQVGSAEAACGDGCPPEDTAYDDGHVREDLKRVDEPSLRDQGGLVQGDASVHQAAREVRRDKDVQNEEL